MKEPRIKKFKYKNDTDEYYVDILMKFWNLYKNDYNCKFMNHYAWKCIRDVTTLKAQQSNTIWSKKARISDKGDEHHLTPVKECFDIWRKCIDDDREFTRKEAEDWVKNATLLVVTKEEHNIIHSKEFNIHKEQNKNIGYKEILKLFKIELEE